LSKLIYFLGPEGVGKSTQITLLYKLLRDRGKKVKIAHVYSKHLWNYLIIKFLFWVGRYKYEHYYDGTRFKDIDETLWLRIYKILLLSEILTTIILAFIRVFIWLWLGYYVLAERYLIDTISFIVYQCLKTDQKFNTRSSDIISKSLTLLKFIPRKTLILILDAKYNTLLNRYRRRNTPLENEEYIVFQRKVGRILARYYIFHYINTEGKSIAEVFDEIKRYVLCSYDLPR
jgi:thymidylate kinase